MSSEIKTRTHKLKPIVTRLLIMAGLCLTSGINQPSALDMGVEASAGYDSNAVLSAQKTGSGFARYRLCGEQSLFSSTTPSGEGPSGSVVLEGQYKDYFDVSDNFRVAASAEIEPPLASKRLVAHLLAEAMVFENRELPEYDNAGPQSDTVLLDVSASRTINQWELFALAGWLDREGAATTDTYKQTRIECGISRLF